MHDVQAAGGAPLSQGSDGRRPRPAGRGWSLLLGVAAAVLLADALTKALVVRELSDREPVSLLGGVLTLRLVRNPGAAFGFAQGLTIAFTVVAVGVVVVILRLSRRLRSTPWAVALGLVLGGAVGNLVDRLFRAPGAGPRPRGRLPRAAALAGVQPGRLRDRDGGRPHGAAVRAWDQLRRHPDRTVESAEPLERIRGNRTTPFLRLVLCEPRRK